MSWLKWIKTAANISTGGASSLYLYGGLFVAGAAVFAAASFWHGAQVEAVRFKAFKAGNDEVQAEWDASENEKLRETQRELTRLVGITNNLNEVYREQVSTIDRMSEQLRARGLRVTKAERDSAIAAGTSEAVRGYATTAADNFAACRGEYLEVGREYGKCSATAQSLDKYAAEVSNRPTAPTPPTPPSKP